MAESIPVGHGADHADHGDHGHHEMTFTEKYVFPLDHKMIAMQYMFTGMFMAIIGGFFAYVFRMQLAFPGIEVPGFGVVTPAAYNSLVTNHGTIMIFWVAMPVLIAAFGNYLIPLMIGADDMVFPKINRLSYQIFLISSFVILGAFSLKVARSVVPGRPIRLFRLKRSTTYQGSGLRCGLLPSS